MREITLTKGMVALVDDEVFDELNSHRWYASKSKNTWYARRDVEVNGKKSRLYMHRVILGATADEDVDHDDHNTMNNQRCNLRRGTTSQNMGNSNLPVTNTSGFKGVTWDKSRNKWTVNVRRNKRSKHLGRFFSLSDAARAYDAGARESFGEFAKTNAMMGLL